MSKSIKQPKAKPMSKADVVYQLQSMVTAAKATANKTDGDVRDGYVHRAHVLGEALRFLA